jgi:hypothetical protein
MTKLSVTESHLAECERLRRLRMNENMLVHIELDPDQVNYLSNLADLDQKQRLDRKIVGASLQACLIYWLKD